MPAEYRIDPAERMVYNRGWGVFTDDDLAAGRAAMSADPTFHPEFDQLYDFTEVTDLRVSSRTLRELAATSPFATTARRAVVVSSEAAFGLARMYAIMAMREDLIQVFRDRESAMLWLKSTRERLGR